MQRKQIKIGETYGIARRYSRRTRWRDLVPAKVVRLDGDREKIVRGSFSRATTIVQDGIVVVFPEDMVLSSYYTFRPLSEMPDGFEENERNMIRAGTEFVLDSPKLIYGEWAPIAEKIKGWEQESVEQAIRADAIADEVEPAVLSVLDTLKALGIEESTEYGAAHLKVKRDTRKTATGDRIVGARFHVSLDAMTSILAAKE